jgi:enoyl-[acyl-carrier protein] reductase I
MGFMSGKKALIVGVASDRSIASGIAEAFAREGCEIAFTYQNDKLKSRVEKLSERLGQNTNLLYPCDVTSDDEIDAVFEALGKEWDGLDILVHSVGFAPREQLAGGFTESVTREGYAISHDISAYSLAALAKAALPMMEGRDGAILTLTYDAATKVVPNYNVMPRQGEPGSLCALPRSRPRVEGHTRQRDLRGRRQDAGCGRYRRLPQDAELRSQGGAVTPYRHDRRDR